MATGVVKNIKKDLDPDDPSKGSIDYRMNSAADPTGLFVTTYYFRDTECPDCQAYKGQDAPWVKTDVYKVGLLQYIKVTEKPEFLGWKVLIYTDARSLETPVFKAGGQNAERHKKHTDEWNEIFKHPNVIFGVVSWPEYSVGVGSDEKTVDNAILRALRLKAFHDYSSIPVFVRDADTLFENIVKVRNMVDELAIWENTFKGELQRIVATTPYKMIVASQPNYHRQWHVHPETGQQTTGCYAAVTSTLGNIPEWVDGSLWRACIAYIRKYSKVENINGERKPNNIDKPTYIGKDEQLISYVVLPILFDKIHFYYLEYIRVEGTKIVMSPETPFAPALIAQGFTRYPSPYMASLGEALPPLEESVGQNRKDENTMTETTLLNPKIIPMSLTPEIQTVMQTIFKTYIKPGSLTTQRGGKRRGSKKRKVSRRKKRSQKRTYRRR